MHGFPYFVAAATASLLGCADSEMSPTSNFPRSSEYAPLDSMLDHAVANHQVPGGIALIMKDGEVAHFRAFGYANPLEFRGHAGRCDFSNLFPNKITHFYSRYDIVGEGFNWIG